MENLFKQIENNVIYGKNNIILIAGASSSGKSYMASKLQDYLESKGVRVAQFSSDMYYKGISRIITEKTFLHNIEFLSYSNKCDEIGSAVRKIIQDSPFPEKFCEDNFIAISNYLKSVMPEFVADKFADKLKGEFERINFDEPFCIDFEELSKDITKFQIGERICVPIYSFRTGESYKNYDELICKDNYDVVIVEGLYTLRNELLTKINLNNVLKVGIDCDTKTLISRRFNRDINSNRCTFTPEQTIMSFISQVMPAYYNYIYETLSRADIVYNTTISSKEINESEHNSQYKFKAPSNVDKLLLKRDATKLSEVEQKDYFLESRDGFNNKNITLRLRCENGLATKLSIKVNKSLVVRAVQEYDLVKLLSEENRSPEKLLTLFNKSGYDTVHVLSKTRQTFKYFEHILKVDKVKDLGTFVEMDDKTTHWLFTDMKYATYYNNFGLKLGKTEYCSYYELYLSNIKNLKHIECEMKYLVKNLSEDDVSKLYDANEIQQFYLNLKNNFVLNSIRKTFNEAFNLEDFKEARIRIINDEEAYLTLKGNGTKIRQEYEKEVPITFAKELTKYATSVVEKNRFLLFESDSKKVELDFYKNKDLCILEIEYDENVNDESDINEFANNIFGDRIELTNVTEDLSYKNQNLAVIIGETYANE